MLLIGALNFQQQKYDPGKKIREHGEDAPKVDSTHDSQYIQPSVLRVKPHETPNIPHLELYFLFFFLYLL